MIDNNLLVQLLRFQRSGNIPDHIQILIRHGCAVGKLQFPQQFGIRQDGFRHLKTNPVKISLHIHALTSSRISMTVRS